MPLPSAHWNTLAHDGQMISYAQFGEDVVLRRAYARSEEAPDLVERLRAPANVRDRYLPYFAFAAMQSASRWNALGPALPRAAPGWMTLKERHPRLKQTLERLTGLASGAAWQ